MQCSLDRDHGLVEHPGLEPCPYPEQAVRGAIDDMLQREHVSENFPEKQTFASYGMLVGGKAQRALESFFEGHQLPMRVPSLE